MRWEWMIAKWNAYEMKQRSWPKEQPDTCGILILYWVPCFDNYRWTNSWVQVPLSEWVSEWERTGSRWVAVRILTSGHLYTIIDELIELGVFLYMGRRETAKHVFQFGTSVVKWRARHSLRTCTRSSRTRQQVTGRMTLSRQWYEERTKHKRTATYLLWCPSLEGSSCNAVAASAATCRTNAKLYVYCPQEFLDGRPARLFFRREIVPKRSLTLSHRVEKHCQRGVRSKSFSTSQLVCCRCCCHCDVDFVRRTLRCIAYGCVRSARFVRREWVLLAPSAAALGPIAR